MSFSSELRESLASRHLLNHPFYQDWMEGKLSMETLREYAVQYYQHVKAFPRYISGTHSVCESLKDRKVLLENLMDEEGIDGKPHPELWLDFAEGLGANRETVERGQAKEAIEAVVETFLKNSKSSYHEGLASLYAYEYQVPEVAESKITGLKEHYQINDGKTLSFFKVHQTADIYHREACEELLDSLNSQEKEEAKNAALESADTLWNFLTSVHTGVRAC